MTYADMHEGLAHFDGAQRRFFEASKRLLKSKCVIEWNVGTECNERTLLQSNEKLKNEAIMLMAFADWMRDERKKQVPTNMNPQKMWQTWSLSDLAGEPNPSNGRPPVNQSENESESDNGNEHEAPFWGSGGMK